VLPPTRAGVYTYDAAYNDVSSTDYHVFTLGLQTDDLEEIILDEDSLGEDGYVPAADNSQLENAFATIAENICRESEKYYTVEFCTPRRDGASHTIRLLVDSGSLGSGEATETKSYPGNFSDGC
jgi:hypothetical protein